MDHMHTCNTLIKSIQTRMIEYLNIWGFMDILSTTVRKILGAPALSMRQIKFRKTLKNLGTEPWTF